MAMGISGIKIVEFFLLLIYFYLFIFGTIFSNLQVIHRVQRGLLLFVIFTTSLWSSQTAALLSLLKEHPGLLTFDSMPDSICLICQSLL